MDIGVGSAVEVLDQPYLDRGDPVFIPNGQRGVVREIGGSTVLVDLGASEQAYVDVSRLRAVVPIAGGSGVSEDFHTWLALFPTLVPQVVNAGTVNSTGQDCIAVDEMGLVVLSGALTGVSTIDVTVQESSVLASGYASLLNGGGVISQITLANDQRVLNFKRTLRFVRTVTIVGGTAAAVAVTVLGNKKVY
jgi:hypothetical protein